MICPSKVDHTIRDYTQQVMLDANRFELQRNGPVRVGHLRQVIVFAIDSLEASKLLGLQRGKHPVRAALAVPGRV
ncbi:MAG: hypothetical protein RL291_958 [Pseudomonadota bacterium]